MTQYAPPSPEDLERLKEQLGMSSGEMAELFSLANGRQWRRYLSEDPNNRRDMGMHMLFFAMARLELDTETFDRILNRMREVGATIELDSE
ncbi:XRE family transcriptional regulator [Burkholderia cenocepacia]|uniref:XRE family transcriptional regulator n=1 Tax=Burkholderia cepacia complex TaxID=87882 RepID=UPI00158C639E|nr:MULTISPECIES: XRE family transcriptional regulator [Burkholderia cepacia complex]MDR8077631.1 XRE family transcriptional regulator [Burkholderia cenocepacia]